MLVNIPKEYLTGESVNNAYIMKYTGKFFSNRIEAVKSILNAKKDVNVIHLGSVSYVPTIESAIKNNTYMHKILTENCKSVLGIDINKEGIEYCKSLGYDNMIYADIVEQPVYVKEKMKEITKERFDYIFAGEILHEIDSPVTMLKAINDNYFDSIKSIIITVPNLYRLLNLKEVLKGIDGNHTDNRYWYSPYTLCKTVAMAGMEPKEIFLSGRSSKLSKLFPHNIAAENIILIADLKETY